nr:uncharacterized protein LOC122172431 [Chrysemys picta bellii]
MADVWGHGSFGGLVPGEQPSCSGQPLGCGQPCPSLHSSLAPRSSGIGGKGPQGLPLPPCSHRNLGTFYLHQKLTEYRARCGERKRLGGGGGRGSSSTARTRESGSAAVCTPWQGLLSSGLSVAPLPAWHLCPAWEAEGLVLCRAGRGRAASHRVHLAWVPGRDPEHQALPLALVPQGYLEHRGHSPSQQSSWPGATGRPRALGASPPASTHPGQVPRGDPEQQALPLAVVPQGDPDSSWPGATGRHGTPGPSSLATLPQPSCIPCCSHQAPLPLLSSQAVAGLDPVPGAHSPELQTSGFSQAATLALSTQALGAHDRGESTHHKQPNVARD